MAETFSPVSLAARRYAGALFALAAEAGCVEAVGSRLAAVRRLLDESDDFRRFAASPVFAAGDQVRAVDALVVKTGLSGTGAPGLAGNFLRVVAANRRLGILSAIIAAFHDQIACMRGELAAEVISARALDVAQAGELKAVLAGATGKDVILRQHVDPALLGGLVVRVGSRQIDTSLRTKLSSLKLALKEVG